MTIQRQYSLPNCSLILEGLSMDGSNGSSPMTVLLNVECHLPGAAGGPLTGGREFLDNLVAAVSRYAQHLLSGVALPLQRADLPPLVELKPGEGPYHHLIVRSDAPTDGAATDSNMAVPLDIRLTTVQFYDLMEAVDQLLVDAQTLPDLALNLNPVPRRFVKPAEPVAKRAAPAVIGATTLAAAALGLFFVPLPEFEPGETSRPAVTEPTAGGTTPPAGTAPPTDPETPAEEPAVAAAAPAPTENAPEITDAATIEGLRQDLAERLQEEWAADPVPAEDWRYEITVSQEGDILGYISRNDAGLANDENTPLPQLLFRPANPTDPVTEPVTRFVTRFTPEADVVVEPVASTTSQVTNQATPVAAVTGLSATIATPIRDGDRIEALNAELRDTLSGNRKSDRFAVPVTYRVRLDEEGNVLGFVPEGAAAEAALDQTPLQDLPTSSQTSLRQADFRVVFTESGTVQVSPWNGWPD